MGDGSGANVGNANIGDPVMHSARKAGFNIFASEVGGCSVQPRLVDILQRIDVDNCIKIIRDFAGNERHGAAARADVKRGGPGRKGIFRHERWLVNGDRQSGFWVGCPDAAVFDAERTAACTRRDRNWSPPSHSSSKAMLPQ